MKKFLSFALVLMLCAGIFANVLPGACFAEEHLSGFPNPLHDSDRQGVLEATGFALDAPEGAEEAAWFWFNTEPKLKTDAGCSAELCPASVIFLPARSALRRTRPPPFSLTAGAFSANIMVNQEKRRCSYEFRKESIRLQMGDCSHQLFDGRNLARLLQRQQESVSEGDHRGAWDRAALFLYQRHLPLSHHSRS